MKEDDEPEEEIQEDVQEEIPDDVLEVNETEMPSAAPAADSGAKAGDVIDLGEDDIPDDEPTLFDL